MAQVQDVVVKVSLDASSFNRQIDSLLEPLTWRHRFIVWFAGRLGVKVEVKRRLRGLDRFRGGYI